MYILTEVMADSSPFRDKFIYLEEVINIKELTMDTDKIRDDHILVIAQFHFGICAYGKYNHPKSHKRWKTIGQMTRDLIKTINNKVCMFLADCHSYTFHNGIEGLVKVLMNNRVDYLWSIYDHNKEINYLKTLMEKKNVNTKFICISNRIKNDIFMDYELPKQYDIVTFGDVSHYYPLRVRMRKLLNTKRFKDQFKIKKIPYGRAKEVGLSKILNQSHLVLASSSIFDYLVKKYFEISASKSMILGDMPQQGIDIFGNNYIKINNDMTDEEIFDIIKDALSNKKKLADMIEKNYNLVHDKHIISRFHEDLYKLISEDISF